LDEKSTVIRLWKRRREDGSDLVASFKHDYRYQKCLVLEMSYSGGVSYPAERKRKQLARLGKAQRLDVEPGKPEREEQSATSWL
jgi:hypothetical protein